MCFSKGFLRFWGRRACKARDFSFKIFKLKFLMSWKCFKTTWNLPREPAELTQKLVAESTTSHSWYPYVVTTAGDYYMVLNAMGLHTLKLLKINCSNTPCSLSMRPIFNKWLQYDWWQYWKIILCCNESLITCKIQNVFTFIDCDILLSSWAPLPTRHYLLELFAYLRNKRIVSRPELNL